MIGDDVIKLLRIGGRGQGVGLFSVRRHSTMAKSVAILGFGTAFSQFLNIISTPVLSWYYTPESFGVMATSLSIVYIVASLSNINYDAAIVLTKNKSQSEDLLLLCLIMNTICFLVFFIFIYFAIGFFENLSEYASFWFLATISIGVLLTSTFNSLQYYAVRIEDYTSSSVSHVIKTLFCLIIQMVGILFNSTTFWLIAGRVFGLVPSIGYLLGRNRATDPKRRLRTRLASLINVAQTYRRFPYYAAPQRVISLVAEEMPTLVLASVFGPSAAGYYWFSSRLLQMPCGVISSAIGRVFSREAIKKIHQGQKAFRPAIKIVAVLALVATPPVVVTMLWAPEMFDAVLDSRWQTAASYSQWIVIWVFFRFSLSPILCLFTVLSEQKRLLKLDSVAFLIRSCLLAYCALKLDALTLVMALSLFESAKIALYGVIILSIARGPGLVADISSPKGLPSESQV